MDYRLLFPALAVENFVALWPAIFLFLGSYSDWFSWLAVYPAVLLVAGSVLTTLGLVRKGKVSQDMLILLIVFSALPVVGNMISLFFYYGFYEEYYTMETCPPNITSYKCTIVHAAGYVDLYVLLALGVSIATFIAAFRKYSKFYTSSVSNQLTR
jgi:uncharacterized membrane protein YwzB